MSEENTVTQPAATPAQPQAQTPELQPNQSADGGAPQAGEGQQPEAQQTAESDEQRNKNRERFDKRFSDLSRKAREAERDAAYWRGVAEASQRNGGQQQPQPQQTTAEPALSGPPDPSKFAQGKYDPDYAVALAEYRIEQKLKAEKDAQSQAERDAATMREIEAGKVRLDGAIAQVRDLAYSEHAEYFQNAERVLGLAYVPVQQGGLPRFVVDAITESDNAAHVAEVLGRDPAQVPESLRALVKSPRDLAQMSPLQVQRVIGRLDDRIGLILEANRARAAAPPTPRQPAPQSSPAQPFPTAPAGGGAPSKDPSKMSMQEFAAWRAAGGGAA